MQGTEGRAGEDASYLGRVPTLTLFAFIVVAFVLLAYRTEIANDQVIKVQRDACESSLEISRQFNREQESLIEIEERNLSVPKNIRDDRIKVYQAVRINPLPICKQG